MTELYLEVVENPSGELGGPPVIGRQQFDQHAQQLATSVKTVADTFSAQLERLQTETAAR